VARLLLPSIADTGWFLDTELLVITERAGLRIHEVPLDWLDDPDSRVDIVATAINNLKGCWRVDQALASGAVRNRQRGQDTGLCALNLTLHPAMRAQAANLTALLMTRYRQRRRHPCLHPSAFAGEPV
jgi:hypothetical protein